MMEDFIKGLDTRKPDWFIVFANQGELVECARGCTDGHSGTVQHRNKLRRDVANRLIEVVQCAITAGIVTIVD